MGRCDPKWILDPLSLQNQKTIAEDEPLKMAENTIGSEKHEETMKNRAIRGLNNDAQELLDLADQ